MWFNYLKMVLAGMGRNKFFTALSLFGISSTVMIVMTVVLIFENSTAARKPESRLSEMLFIKRVKVVVKDESVSIGNVGRRLAIEYIAKLKTPALVSVSSMDRFEIFFQGKLISQQVLSTDPNYWRIYDFDFVTGRPFSLAEFNAKAQVIVISRSLAEYFFGSTQVVGKLIKLRSQEFRVLGVVENPPYTSSNCFAQAWVPSSLIDVPSETAGSGNWSGECYVTLLPNTQADKQKVIEDVNDLMRKLNIRLASKKTTVTLAGPDDALTLYVRGYQDEEKFKGITQFYLKWTAFILLFLLLPSVNLMSLNITRIRERSTEIAVRKAFGASRGVLIKQLLIENIILTIMGGIVGLSMAYGVLKIFSYQLFNVSPDMGDVDIAVSVNFSAFILTLMVCFIFGIFSGILPALKMSKLNPAEVLKGGSK